MGTGEYISMTNQTELVHAEVAVERTTLARFPAAEQAELAATFRGYGADPDTAAKMAAAVSKDPDVALRVHTREELALGHTDLRSALLVGGDSLAAFSIGAVLPLLPYLIGRASLLAAMLITAVALVSGGTVVGPAHRPAAAPLRRPATAAGRGRGGGDLHGRSVGSSAVSRPELRRAVPRTHLWPGTMR